MKRLIIAPIRLYQRVLSPMKMVPTCRFAPTCSSYAIEAVQARGAVMGLLLAVWRVLRCNPLCRGGHDPVPAAKAAPVKARLTEADGRSG